MEYDVIISEVREYKIKVEGNDALEALKKSKKYYKDNKNIVLNPLDAKVASVNYDVKRKQGIVHKGNMF